VLRIATRINQKRGDLLRILPRVFRSRGLLGSGEGRIRGNTRRNWGILELLQQRVWSVAEEEEKERESDGGLEGCISGEEEQARLKSGTTLTKMPLLFLFFCFKLAQ